MRDGFQPGQYPPQEIWKNLPAAVSCPMNEIYVKYIIVRDSTIPDGVETIEDEKRAQQVMSDPLGSSCTVGFEKRKGLDGLYYWELMCDKDEHFGTQLPG